MIGEVMTPKKRDFKIKDVSKKMISDITLQLKQGKPVRRNFLEWGRIHIDRPLPFLVLYRQTKEVFDWGTDFLVTSEASYTKLPSNFSKDHKSLLKAVGSTLCEEFGGFLLIEVWSSNEVLNSNKKEPRFDIYRPTEGVSSAIEVFETELSKIKIQDNFSKINVLSRKESLKGNYVGLFSPKELKNMGWSSIGIEVSPIYLNRVTGETFPMIQKRIERGFSKSLQKAVFEFTKNNTNLRPKHFQSLGRRRVVKAIWEIDRQLAEIGNSFDFLLLATPVNVDEAWGEFKKSKFQRRPDFLYRPMPIDPLLIKRQLYKVPIEKIEDPSLSHLFREQQLYFERMLTMLSDRNSKHFMHESFQLYGSIEPSLLKTAKKILASISKSKQGAKSKKVSAREFALLAQREIDYYKKLYPEFDTKVFLRKDVSGVMVSGGNFLINENLEIAKSRVQAVIHHEIGTHALTYYNGKAQPFQQMYIGLPGYDETQEALAVFSEYLCGQLSGSRLRFLAARAITAFQMTQGKSFAEIYSQLTEEYNFSGPAAFNITFRVFRGGGLTKDMVYLKGLIKLLDYLKKGNDFEPFFLGKFSISHMDIIRELELRKILKPAPLRPRILNDSLAIERLKKAKAGMSVLSLYNS